MGDRGAFLSGRSKQLSYLQALAKEAPWAMPINLTGTAGIATLLEEHQHSKEVANNILSHSAACTSADSVAAAYNQTRTATKLEVHKQLSAVNSTLKAEGSSMLNGGKDAAA